MNRPLRHMAKLRQHVRDLFGQRIGPLSIKESIDNLPSGVCFSDKNGAVILQNQQMSKLFRTISNSDLQFIDELHFCLREPPSTITSITSIPWAFRLEDGTVWQFMETGLTTSGGTRFLQTLAIDITELTGYMNDLSTENEALRAANKRALDLYQEIDALVRQEQNYAARALIHDEMGELLGKTRSLLRAEHASLESLHEAGRQWADLPRKVGDTGQDEAREPECSIEDSFRQLRETIEAIGVQLTVQGDIPFEDETTAYLLMTALRECAINAVRHADANEMTMTLTESPGLIHMTIVDNGTAPKTTIVEGGGLTALRRRVENAGGSMLVESLPAFRLNITVPMKGEAS